MSKDSLLCCAKPAFFLPCRQKAHCYYLLFLLCTIPLLQSCSGNFAYNNLDWLVHWYVDDYVEMTPEQRQSFDQHFAKLQQWHRDKELVRYQAFLKSIQQALTEEKLTGKPLARSVTEKSRESYRFWLDLVQAASVPLAQLAKTLSEEQKKQLNLAIHEQMRELDKKAERNDQPAARRNRLIKAVTPWLGELSRKQQTLVRQWSLKMIPTRQVLGEYRQNWAKGLEKAFDAPPDQLPFHLNRVLLEQELWQSQTYQETISANRRLTEQLIAELLDSRSNAQNRKLLKELNRWINRLERLKHG